MSVHWDSVVKGDEKWPRLGSKNGEELSRELRDRFIAYVEKTLHWLDYFVMDPRWLNLTAVNYAANAAREAASEVKQVRLQFEREYELTRDDLATTVENSSSSDSAESQSNKPSNAA